MTRAMIQPTHQGCHEEDTRKPKPARHSATTTKPAATARSRIARAPSRVASGSSSSGSSASPRELRALRSDMRLPWRESERWLRMERRLRPERWLRMERRLRLDALRCKPRAEPRPAPPASGGRARDDEGDPFCSPAPPVLSPTAEPLSLRSESTAPRTVSLEGTSAPAPAPAPTPPPVTLTTSSDLTLSRSPWSCASASEPACSLARSSRSCWSRF